MKPYKLSLFTFVMALAFFSCQDDKVDLAPVAEEPVILEIMEGQQSYIGETGKYFYTDIFSHKNDTSLYRLKVKAGAKYHLICTQHKIFQTWIKMTLSNSKGEVIANSETYEGRPVGSKPEIIFTAADDNDLFLTVSLWGYNIESLKYNLYFQECAVSGFNFKGYTWESVGNWKITNSETLEFTGSDSKEFHWIRLIANATGNVELSYTMKSTTKTALPSFGFIYNGSAQMINWGEYAEELPGAGTFYNIYDTDRYRIMNLGGGISYNYGDVYFPNFDMKKGVRVQLNPDQTMIENVLIPECINIASKKIFYVVIEDIGFDKITLENFQLKAN